MGPCKNKLSYFPYLTGCDNTNFTIPILVNDAGHWKNYNITYEDFICGITISGGSGNCNNCVTGGTINGDILTLTRSNGTEVNLILPASSGGTGTCDNCVTGGTISNNILTLVRSNGTEIYLPFSDVYLTGGTLSGTTLILTNSDGSNVYTDLSPLGATLVSSDVFITVLSAATHDAVLFTNSAATYVTVGGIEAGSVFSGVTMQDMWTDLLYPNLAPNFTYFNVGGYVQSVDVGYTIPSGNTLFTWGITYPAFLSPNKVDIYDATSGWIPLAIQIPNDNSETITIPYSIQKTTSTSHSWYIYAKRNTGVTITAGFGVTWYWRRFWGTSTDPLLDATGIVGLANSQLAGGFGGTFGFASNNYKYFVFPTAWGAPSYIRDVATNLNIALAGASDGYTLTVNGLPCRIVSVSNPYGYSTPCYVFRTKYQLGANKRL